jgi:hypothetical protein
MRALFPPVDGSVRINATAIFLLFCLEPAGRMDVSPG